RTRRTTAARWPSSGLAAADDYENAPHDGVSIGSALRDVEYLPYVFWATPRRRAVLRPLDVVERRLPAMEQCPHERFPGSARDRQARIRRLPSRGIRLLLPQRDRPPPGDARGDPRWRDGRVRRRRGCRHRVAALGRTH